MKALLTGSSGFVGRNLLLHWLSQNRYEKIILPVRNPKKLKEQLKKEGVSDLACLEICDSSAPAWENLKGTKVDHLVHGAGLLFGGSKKEFFETNVEGTVNLFHQVDFERAIVVSSQAASGPCRMGQSVKTEQDEDLPITWYGQSKLEMEKRLQDTFSNKNYLCVRPPMILGPRDTATLPLFKMANSRLLFKPGLKPKHYSYVGVKDLVSGIDQALQSSVSLGGLSSRSLYIACPESITDEALIRTAAEAVEKPGVLIKVPQTILKGVSKLIDAVPAWRKAVPSLAGDRALEIWPERWVVSSKQFSEAFSWKPEDGLLQNLQEAYRWYLRNGDI